ncbi:16S rRNA (cytosine(1402)-N(4))-methyltransferase RsmH [Pseudomonadota bacterium]|nr:16S rRNA (cytosine(1402)-N(4))-methyltransferase RsmH [Pseudomonadota bacterium]
MTDSHSEHLPVLLNETVASLAVKAGGIYIDGTFGRGGHARQVLSQLSEQGRLLGLDKDPAAIETAKQLSLEDPRFSIEQCSFADMSTVVNERLWQGKVDGILLDIGVSSPQIDVADRGFSFQKEGPLDMRMNPDIGISAAEWLATAKVEDITFVIKTLGEERFGKRIANAIVETREHTPIISTTQLAALVDKAMPFREKNKHPATRTFQAIRIYINNELEDLKTGLEQALDALAIGGRLSVITFHSLEDRIVKRYFRDEAKGDDLPSNFPIRAEDLHPRIKLIGKATKAGELELAINPRARSAVLRVVEKVL